MGWGSTSPTLNTAPPNPQDAAAAFQEAPAPTILAQNIDDKMVQIDTWRILTKNSQDPKDPMDERTNHLFVDGKTFIKKQSI